MENLFQIATFKNVEIPLSVGQLGKLRVWVQKQQYPNGFYTEATVKHLLKKIKRLER